MDLKHSPEIETLNLEVEELRQSWNDTEIFYLNNQIGCFTIQGGNTGFKQQEEAVVEGKVMSSVFSILILEVVERSPGSSRLVIWISEQR